MLIKTNLNFNHVNKIQINFQFIDFTKYFDFLNFLLFCSFLLVILNIQFLHFLSIFL